MTVAEGFIEVELCAPEREPVHLEAREVLVPGAAGVFTVLPGHTPLLSSLGTGVMIAYLPGGGERFLAVNGGFAEVLNDRVVVLTQTMEQAESIDVARAEEAKQRAETRLKKPDEDTDVLRAETALARAMARLQAHRGEGPF